MNFPWLDNRGIVWSQMTVIGPAERTSYEVYEMGEAVSQALSRFVKKSRGDFVAELPPRCREATMAHLSDDAAWTRNPPYEGLPLKKFVPSKLAKYENHGKFWAVQQYYVIDEQTVFTYHSGWTCQSDVRLPVVSGSYEYTIDVTGDSVLLTVDLPDHRIIIECSKSRDDGHERIWRFRHGADLERTVFPYYSGCRWSADRTTSREIERSERGILDVGRHGALPFEGDVHYIVLSAHKVSKTIPKYTFTPFSIVSFDAYKRCRDHRSSKPFEQLKAKMEERQRRTRRALEKSAKHRTCNSTDCKCDERFDLMFA